MHDELDEDLNLFYKVEECCFSMGSGVISWFSRKQSYVALSTAEAEYVASCSANCEAIWLRKLLSDLFNL